MTVLLDETLPRAGSRSSHRVDAGFGRHGDILAYCEDAVVAMNADHVVILFNPGAERLFGYAASEVLGRPVSMLMPASYRAHHAASVADFGATGARARSMGERGRVRGLRKNGEEFNADSTICRYEVEGEPVYAAIMRDVTERVQLEAHLRRALGEAQAANQAKSNFVAMMSHELRTPLNAIIGFSDIIANQVVGPVSARYSEYAQDICESARHLLAVINDILDMVRVGAQQIELTESVFPLVTEVAAAVRLVRERAQQQGLSIEIDVPASLRVNADRQLIRQMLINLLSNAVKFTPRGGHIDVAAAEGPDGALIIKVADNGIGISMDDLPKVTEPFFQAANPLQRQHEGTGLGLALVRSFAELHGGRLLLSSAYGIGTTAQIVLPAGRTACAP
jgi:PAS domain S-box-containing protein